MNAAAARGIALERRWRSVLPVAFLTAFVVGCGGSGGGTDSTGSTGPTGSTIESSGLVPTAPAPGSVLVTNALDHRPVVSGAVWSYRNWETGSTGLASVYHDSPEFRSRRRRGSGQR
jgi:hypothetical protein